MTTKRGLLDHLGLHRPALRAWAMYDWGISGMQTVIMAAVFPIFFLQYAAHGLTEKDGLEWYGYAKTAAAVCIAILSPILGAVADFKAAKKRFLGTFMLLGVGATSAMYFIGQGDVLTAAILLVLSLAGSTGSVTFYEALLPHIAKGDEIDRVSTAGYALGYIGGGLLLLLNVVVIQDPGIIGLPMGDGLTPEQASMPVRLSFVSVGVWWLLFSIPVLTKVPEPPRTVEPDERPDVNAISAAFTRLGETLRELRGYKQAFLMMVAFTIYNDGIQTIIGMAAAYGTAVGIQRDDLIKAILIVQFVGVPFAFLFGFLAKWFGAKRSVLFGIAAYAGICIFAYFMDTTREFYMLAFMVAFVQGGTQALSRSMFANMIPRHKSGEFFGFFSVFEKVGGIAGPLLFTLAIGAGETTSTAILSVIVFFIAGFAVLWFVDPKEGERVAREADAAVRPV
jgi:MFS transporter, UMF1 family